MFLLCPFLCSHSIPINIPILLAPWYPNGEDSNANTWLWISNYADYQSKINTFKIIHVNHLNPKPIQRMLVEKSPWLAQIRSSLHQKKYESCRDDLPQAPSSVRSNEMLVVWQELLRLSDELLRIVRPRPGFGLTVKHNAGRFHGIWPGKMGMNTNTWSRLVNM